MMLNNSLVPSRNNADSHLVQVSGKLDSSVVMFAFVSNLRLLNTATDIDLEVQFATLLLSLPS